MNAKSRLDIEDMMAYSDGCLPELAPYEMGNGNILEWYGTNTDIHDLVMARIEAARNKLQILRVLALAEASLFSINKERIITMMEGGMLWDSQAEIYNVSNKSSLVGKDAIEAAKQTQPGGCPSMHNSPICPSEFSPIHITRLWTLYIGGLGRSGGSFSM
jgi:hypothetical protein